MPPASEKNPPEAPATSSTRAALTLLGALWQGGMDHLVVCPGSRSAPLAVAAALLEGRGLCLHTALDERSAAFFALGLGRAHGRPAGVITTSGTAVANLLPAAVEADHSTIPLLLLTADRPARLKGCGANQSVNQEAFLACSCRWLGQGDPQGLGRMGEGDLRTMATTALAATLGQGGTSPAGPVQLNLAIEEPLHPSGAAIAALAARRPIAAAPRPPQHGPGPLPSADRAAGAAGLDPDRPGVVVAGPWRGSAAAWDGHLRALRQWHRRSGWPVLADALSGLRGIHDLPVVGSYDLILARSPAELATRQVLRLGPLPASRRLQRWLAERPGRQVLVSEGDPRRLDPLGKVQQQWGGGLAAWVAAQIRTDPACRGSGAAAAADAPQTRRWLQAEAALQRLLEQVLDCPAEAARPSEPWLARRLAQLLPQGLPVMLANSSPVRDWESFTDPAAPGRQVFSFRGASGIDGTLSCACGLAEALGRLVLVSGDLALLHDSNGWLWQQRLRGQLTVVMIDNQGGGIFEQLPIRTDPEEVLDFERLFAMPQPVDPAALAAAHGIRVRPVRRCGDLETALDWALSQRLSLVSVYTDRRADAALRLRLRTMAARELGPSLSLPLPPLP